MLHKRFAYNDGRDYFPQAETKNDLHLVVISQTKVKQKIKGLLSRVLPTLCTSYHTG